MNAPTPPPPPPPGVPPAAALPPAAAKQGRGCMFYGCMVTLVLLVVIGLTALGTAWWVHRTINAKAIVPVELTAQEEVVLSNKVAYVSEAREVRLHSADTAAAAIDEDFVRKPIILTEREINAILANNTDLADKVRVLLRPDEILALANLPIDPSAPFLGGRTIRAKVSLHVELKRDALDLRIRNISIMGMPLPNAWLGGLIGKNLVQEAVFDDAVMKAFVEGIEELRVESGQIYFLPAE